MISAAEDKVFQLIILWGVICKAREVIILLYMSLGKIAVGNLYVLLSIWLHEDIDKL